jgi:hypothetical protein
MAKAAIRAGLLVAPGALGWLIDHFGYDLFWALIDRHLGLRQADAVATVAAHATAFLLAAVIVGGAYFIGARRSQWTGTGAAPAIDLSKPRTVPIRLAHFLSSKALSRDETGLLGVVRRYASSALESVRQLTFYLIPGLNYEVETPVPVRDRRLFNRMVSQSEFFAQRFAEAFPDLRSPETFTDRHEIANRLGTLLHRPLSASYIDGFQQRIITPLSWSRGLQSMSIQRWYRIKPSTFLLNEHELEINKICAIPSRAYWRNYVYVECVGQRSVGLIYLEPQDILRIAQEHGYCDEEYSIYNFRAYTIHEDDDGGYVRSGRVRRFNHPRDRRVRYLSKFNFLIAQGTSPALANNLEVELEERLNACLNNDAVLPDFIDWLTRLPKNPAMELTERI